MELLNFAAYLPYTHISIGIILILVSAFYKSGAERLAKTGKRCEGIIFKLNYSDSNSYNESDTRTKNKITVRFVTQKEEWITGDLNTDFMITWTGQLKEGQAVPVLYDPNNPADFTIETKQSPQLVKIIFVFAGVILTAVGVYKLFEGS